MGFRSHILPACHHKAAPCHRRDTIKIPPCVCPAQAQVERSLTAAQVGICSVFLKKLTKEENRTKQSSTNSSSVMEEKIIILERLSHEARFLSQRYNQLNNQWPYAIVTTAVFCLKISCAPNEIYSLTGKSNGDAASG